MSKIRLQLLLFMLVSLEKIDGRSKKVLLYYESNGHSMEVLLYCEGAGRLKEVPLYCEMVAQRRFSIVLSRW